MRQGRSPQATHKARVRASLSTWIPGRDPGMTKCGHCFIFMNIVYVFVAVQVSLWPEGSLDRNGVTRGEPDPRLASQNKKHTTAFVRPGHFFLVIPAQAGIGSVKLPTHAVALCL